MKDIMKMKRRDFLLSAIATTAAVMTSSSASAEAPMKVGEIGVEANVKDLDRVTQKLVNPPFLPVHDQVAKSGPKVVEVVMDIEEKEIEVSPGVFVQAMTFNGTNPGPMMVAHEGDYLELTLRNPQTSSLTHS